VVAVSPIIGDAPVSGPAGRLLAARGLPVSAVSVAALYSPWLDALVVDHRDAARAAELTARGVRPVVGEAVMADGESETRLARLVLDAAGLAR
jgi:LPPG:FO 2-phospho-L-lactate transferase